MKYIKKFESSIDKFNRYVIITMLEWKENYIFETMSFDDEKYYYCAYYGIDNNFNIIKDEDKNYYYICEMIILYQTDNIEDAKQKLSMLKYSNIYNL